MSAARSGAVCPPSENGGCVGDLGGLNLKKLYGLDHSFDPLSDCILYSLCACLFHFSLSLTPFLISTLSDYINMENGQIFSGKSRTMGRAVAILEKYFEAIVERKDFIVDLVKYDMPCLCRVGCKGSVGTHIVFIENYNIWSLDKLPLHGQVVYDCRTVVLTPK